VEVAKRQLTLGGYDLAELLNHLDWVVLHP
jgi:hypothetical protein